MSVFSKKEHRVVPPPVIPYNVEVRKELVKDDGTVNVIFEDVEPSVISKEQLDPRLVTLERLLGTNTMISPQGVANILDISDPNDLEYYSGRLSENAYNRLRDTLKDWDFEKNVQKVEVDTSIESVEEK